MAGEISQTELETSNAKKVHLGYFNAFDDAVAARKAAEVEHNFHPNHGEQR